MTADRTGPSTTAARGVAAEADFATALDVAAAIAALSPSSHNCQPWAVAWARTTGARAATARALAPSALPPSVLGPDRVPSAGPAGLPSDPAHPARPAYLVLALDNRRRLRALPALHVEMLVSCGAYWRLLLRALAAQGWGVDGLRLAPGGLLERPGAAYRWPGPGPAHWPRTWAPLCVARLRYDAGDAARAEELPALRAAAGALRTHRAPYRPEPLAPELLERLEGEHLAGGPDTSGPVAPPREAAEVTPAPGIAVRHLTTDADRAALADVVARHAGRDFSHGPAWRETHAYLRFSEADAVARGDGFTLGELFGPLSWPHERALRLALAPATMRALRHVGYPELLARQLAAVVRPTPALTVMSLTGTRPPTLADGVRAGARVADYWLYATGEGLVLHPISAVLQHEEPRRLLEDRFRIKGRAFFLSRIGRPATEFPAFPRSHRRSAGTALRTI
ncbi:RedV protein [Streptomyces longispororuber]|uniref:RedV protein n=1 Tax=Streptomyces longispororuber TaxID=68230 RepID=A0A919DX05_9ACTN|nr:RedV protein [Streptomyces longispororuber]GHE88861.1 RedV protein [Streptomyces longispororuber]